MKNEILEEYQKWLDSPAISDAEWNELNALAGNEEELSDRFYAPLDFGTAGLRGVMGLGLHRMNLYVVRHATQAFADVICTETEAGLVVICYDCRNNSALFAQEAACVMAANGIHVLLFDEMRPTPELSFAIRYHGATAGINLTASHNPKEYNGYKVYWSDGAQLPPEQAAAIAKNMRNSDLFTAPHRMDFEKAKESGLIRLIGAETDAAFLQNVMAQSIDKTAVAAAKDMKIVYTPLHGTGRLLIPEALRRVGVSQLFCVEEQMVPDGNFPTVKNPNPEFREGFACAEALAKTVEADLVIGSDPDADRLAVLVRQGNDYFQLTGNQLGVLLLDYIIRARRAAGTLPENAVALKSIVSTPMARRIAEENGVAMVETFTGFKFMAEKMKEFEQDGRYTPIFAFEESIGYLVGDFVRDKDAVTAAVLTAEMCAAYRLRGMTLAEALHALYEQYGFYAEKTLNLVMPGLDGLEKMAALMVSLRDAPPAEIAGSAVIRMRDYLIGAEKVSGLGVVAQTEISGADVLSFMLEDDTEFIVRPSGTEPKIKIYLLVKAENSAACEEKLEKYAQFAQKLNR